MVDGRAAVVVHLLAREPGRPRAARVTHDPPCRACERRLQYDAMHRRWMCPDCRATHTPTVLAAVCLGPSAAPGSYSVASPVRPPICCERRKQAAR